MGSVHGAECVCPLPALAIAYKTGPWAGPQAGFPHFSVPGPVRKALGGWRSSAWPPSPGWVPWQTGGSPGLGWRGGAGSSVRSPSLAPSLCSSSCPVPPKRAEGSGTRSWRRRGGEDGDCEGGAQRGAARAWTRSTLRSSRRSAVASSSCAGGCRRCTASSRRTSRHSRMIATTGRRKGPQLCAPTAAPQPWNAEPREGLGMLTEARAIQGPRRPHAAGSWVLLHLRTLSREASLMSTRLSFLLGSSLVLPFLPLLLPSCCHWAWPNPDLRSLSPSLPLLCLPPTQTKANRNGGGGFAFLLGYSDLGTWSQAPACTLSSEDACSGRV